ncbi:formylglycine-generating enzyme family protein [Candidatus Magnetaquicoccus inordinatus]|uniref:formylglycine-generating enzyme family protein n=1 Tax=Candidatus Magnetaquicoccus inordinatus TaxID=2496818 RepID=UPI00102AADD4|nr:SUMF1/EgtB/PvdO family nonheme iron enzyme [Candidatus Magnetaquicoccus inordinatus]
MSSTPEQPPLDPNQGSRICCPITGMPLVWVPGGLFRMGDDSMTARNNEQPAHEVQLQGFWLGQYPVTQGEWFQVMGSNLSHFKRGDNYPVESVSWHDVQEFIRTLNSKGSALYRLPSEAEWEYAARFNGAQLAFSGSNQVDEVAWHSDNSDGSTHPVGQKSPNALGLHDMSGNVWEWVADWYDPAYYAESTRDNPQGPVNGIHRVKRGGSWQSAPALTRATFRYDSNPSGWYEDLGFRLLREK